MPDPRIEEVRPERFHVRGAVDWAACRFRVGPPNVPRLPALKPRQQVPVQVAAVVLEGRVPKGLAPNFGLGVLQKGLRQVLKAHLLGGSPVGASGDLTHPLGQ